MQEIWGAGVLLLVLSALWALGRLRDTHEQFIDGRTRGAYTLRRLPESPLVPNRDLEIHHFCVAEYCECKNRAGVLVRHLQPNVDPQTCLTHVLAAQRARHPQALPWNS